MSNTDPFEKYASKLTSDQFRQVRETMDELGLKRTDALFHVVAALDYYRVLYEEVPAKIKEAGDNALQAVDQAARRQGEREFAEARRSLAEEVVAAARKLSASRDTTNLLIFALFAVGTAVIAIMVAFIIGRLSANDAYRANTAAAVTWYSSVDGQYAKYLSEHGVLEAIRICRAQNRTLAIGPTTVRCGVMRTPMRDGQDYPPLPAGDKMVPGTRSTEGRTSG